MAEDSLHCMGRRLLELSSLFYHFNFLIAICTVLVWFLVLLCTAPLYQFLCYGALEDVVILLLLLLLHGAHESIQGLELVIVKDGLDSGVWRRRCQLKVRRLFGTTQMRCRMHNDR